MTLLKGFAGIWMVKNQVKLFFVNTVTVFAYTVQVLPHSNQQLSLDFKKAVNDLQGNLQLEYGFLNINKFFEKKKVTEYVCKT